MSAEPTPSEREELLRAASCGELDRSRPEIAARLASDPELARELDELERARAATSRVMHEARDMLAGARAHASAADRELVEHGLRSLASQRGPEGRRSWPWLLALAAAALVLAFFALRPRPASPAEPAPTWLGQEDGPLKCEPGEGGSFRLTWDVPKRTLETLELGFYADDDGHPGALLLGPLEVDGGSWAPDEAQARLLGKSWFAELVRRSGDEAHVMGRRHGPPR